MNPPKEPATPRPAATPTPTPDSTHVRLRTAAVAPPDPRRLPAPPASMHYALLLLLTYAMGPLSILLTPSGRRRRAWVIGGVIAAVAAVTLLTVPFARIAAAAGGAGPLLWCGLALLATAGGCTVWARALHLAAGEAVLMPARLPRTLRRPWLLTLFGMLAPGSGLLLAGRRLGAALTLWLLWPAALGALILLHAGDIWRSVPQVVAARQVGVTLEATFLAAAAAVAAGLLLWLVQALESMRQTTRRASSRHGDWYGLALGASCLALAATANPQRIAEHLATGAQILRADRYQLIPLYLNLTAARFEPANADHAIEALVLYEQMGRGQEASRLRQRLDADLDSYLAMLAAESDDALTDGPAQHTVPPPAAVERDPAPQPDADLYFGLMGGPATDTRSAQDTSRRPVSQSP